MTKREAGKVAARKRIIRFVELCKYPVTNNGVHRSGSPLGHWAGETWRRNIVAF